MKDSPDSAAVGRAPAPEPEEFANRKLIRPSMNRIDMVRAEQAIERRERAERGDRVGGGGKKSAPPEQTHAENFYYQKQMQGKTPLIVVLKDGEEMTGYIEWYDRNCIKLTRNNQPNVLIYKPSIKYIYKQSEETGRK
jgi:host factor-I protein